MDHYDGRMKTESEKGILAFYNLGEVGLSNPPTPGGPHRVHAQIADSVSNLTARKTMSTGLCIQAEKPRWTPQPVTLVPTDFSVSIALIPSPVSSSTI